MGIKATYYPSIPKFANQILPAAAKSAVYQTAKDIQKTLLEQAPKYLDRPNPFTLKGFQFKAPTKEDPTAIIFIEARRDEYMHRLIEGGTETVKPGKRTLLNPVNINLNKYGNITRNRAKKLMSQKTTFSGKVKGVPGIYRRVKKKKEKGVKLLIRYADKRVKSKMFPFYAICKRVAEVNFNANFNEALKFRTNKFRGNV